VSDHVRFNDFLASLQDPRRSQGQRHQFNHVMSIVIMAILSGYQGLRGFTRFARANSEALDEVFHFKHGYPKFNTIRSVLSALDQQVLIQQFICWAKDSVPGFTEEAISLDGKAIRATTNGGNTEFQAFVSLVNAFGAQSHLVYGMQPFNNSKSGEGEALRQLIINLGLTDRLFSMDALHTQKKR
jgi:hypothetical protein